MKTNLIENVALCGISVELNIFDCLAVKELVRSYEEYKRLKSDYEAANNAYWKATRGKDDDAAIEAAKIIRDKTNEEYNKCDFSEQDALSMALHALKNFIKELPADFEGATIFKED